MYMSKNIHIILSFSIKLCVTNKRLMSYVILYLPSPASSNSTTTDPYIADMLKVADDSIANLCAKVC